MKRTLIMLFVGFVSHSTAMALPVGNDWENEGAQTLSGTHSGYLTLDFNDTASTYATPTQLTITSTGEVTGTLTAWYNATVTCVHAGLPGVA